MEQVLVIDASQITPYVCLESEKSPTTRSIRKGESVLLFFGSRVLTCPPQLCGDARATAG